MSCRCRPCSPKSRYLTHPPTILARPYLLLSLLILSLCNTIVPVPAQANERPTLPGGAYDKPYIQQSGSGTSIGGYIDHELFWNDNKKTFDQHRFIPFFYSEVSERIHVLAELEFEHGGLVKGNGDSDGEIKLEFATLDIHFSEAVNYRAGVILSPLGLFNLIHDSPLNDLTNRPLLARQIVPTTLSESGMGFFGTIYPSEESLLSYEFYTVNGFNSKTAGSIRSGRGSHKTDNNDDKSLVGRLHFSPFLGLDLGGSLHWGAYDDAGDHNLTIFAVDGLYKWGPLDFIGEFARATVDGAEEDSRLGYYGQVGYHFLPGAVKTFPNSIFTATGRYDYIDLGAAEETRYTFGINFRPEETTVLKLDYELYDQDEDSNGLLFSVASYF
ncbi:MAG: hypothetical protein GKR89_14295 [Candidatus Latescibacteria bacterium]|nr:hypothetical protein [Candidatus Latescibacterota bacterium]